MKKPSNPLPVGKNDDIRLEITAFSALGTGIGRYAGFTVFVDGAVPGDTIDAHIIKVKPTYAVGIIRRVVKPSKDRIAPDCAVADRCGGCSFRALSYDAELRYKKQKVQDALTRIGGLNVAVREILSTGAPGTLPETLARTGYCLCGWQLERGDGLWYGEDGWQEHPDAAAAFAPGARLTLEEDWPAGYDGDFFAFHALWQPNRYTVRYASGLKGLAGLLVRGKTPDSAHVYDEAAPLSLCGFSLWGRRCTGWSTEPGGGQFFPAGEPVLDLCSEPDGLVTLYAVWE